MVCDRHKLIIEDSDSKNHPKYSVVWVFIPDSTDFVNRETEKSPFKLTRTKVLQPDHISPRIISQAGWFTVHKFLEEKSKIIVFEKNKPHIRKLIKIKIPKRKKLFDELNRDLNRSGINGATVFPDLDGICKYIKWERTGVY